MENSYTDLDEGDLQALWEQHQKNLGILERQAAKHGMNPPLPIINEIDSAKEKLTVLRDEFSRRGVSPQVFDSATNRVEKSDKFDKILQPIKPAFLHRLKVDVDQLVSFTKQGPDIRIIEAESDMPIKFVLEFNIKGISDIDNNGKPLFIKKHIVEMIVHNDYPLSMPFVQFYTPLFHPNIWDGGKVCLGWFSIPYNLSNICIHLAKMIDYQVYDFCSPANKKAANWASINTELFPLANWIEPSAPLHFKGWTE